MGCRASPMDDVEMTRSTRVAVSGVLAANLTAFGLIQSLAAQAVAATELKAAYLLNFAQFVEWPADAVPVGSALMVCIVNDDGVAHAVDKAILNRSVDGHGLTVKRFKTGLPLPGCHILYLGSGELKSSLEVVETVKGLFLLTVSDAKRFAENGGMVELFVEGGRMRFAVNTDALQRAHVRLGSRVLGLATIVRDAERH